MGTLYLHKSPMTLCISLNILMVDCIVIHKDVGAPIKVILPLLSSGNLYNHICFGLTIESKITFKFDHMYSVKMAVIMA